MNGISHNAIIENCSNVPPSNIAKKSNHCASTHCLSPISANISANGTGITTKNLYTANIINVKKIFFLRVLEANIDFTTSIINVNI